MEGKYNRVPTATSKTNQSDCKVKVVVRIRPQLPSEAGQSVTSVEGDHAVLLRNPKLKSSEATRYK